MAADELRTPERVLDEIYDTGQRLLRARARQRAHGPGLGESSAGDNPPDYVEPAAESRASDDVRELRGRFRALADAFVDAVERP